MVENEEGFEDQGVADFTVVTETYSTPAQTRRRSASVTVRRSGYCATNVNGTGEFQKLVTALGGKFEDLNSMKFGANEAKNLVAAYIAKDGEPGAATVKQSKDKKTVSFHLGHIFDKYPLLRPAGDLSCSVKFGKDKKGTACVIINLKGTAVRKGRTTADSSAPAQPK